MERQHYCIEYHQNSQASTFNVITFHKIFGFVWFCGDDMHKKTELCIKIFDVITSFLNVPYFWILQPSMTDI